jgi:hypothetical protein
MILALQGARRANGNELVLSFACCRSRFRPIQVFSPWRQAEIGRRYVGPRRLRRRAPGVARRSRRAARKSVLRAPSGHFAKADRLPTCRQ